VACSELIKAMGIPHENVMLCDTQGVIYRGRERGMNQWKSAHAVDTDARTLADALRGADAVFGLSVKGAFTPEMIRSMADKPIIFAMANPGPEITPEEARAVRADALIATAAATTRTRSTTSWASPTSSAVRWTCARPRSTTPMKVAGGLRHRGAGARGGADEVWRPTGPEAALRPGVPDPHALRPAPDHGRARPPSPRRDRGRRARASRS
jgi:hypothetical protein